MLVAAKAARFRISDFYDSHSLSLPKVRVGLKPFPDQAIKLFPGGSTPNALNNFAGKGMDQHPTGGLGIDAASPQIENGLFIQLTYGGTVCAFDIVGVDLQLGFGIDGGVLGKEQVLVRLLGIRFLGGLLHEDAAMENALGAPLQNAIVIFMAVAVRLGVFDDHVVIGKLFAPGQVKPVQHAFNALRSQGRADGVAGKPGAGGDGMGNPIATAAQLRVNRRDVKGTWTFILKFAMFDHRAFAQYQLRDRIGKILPPHGTDIALDNRCLGRLVHQDKVPRMRGSAVLLGRGDKKQMNWGVHYFPGGHMNKSAILEEGKVQRGERIVSTRGIAAQVLFDPPEAFANVNTREDLAALAARLSL